MKRLLLGAWLLCSLLSASAFGDSISIYLTPNLFGDNVAFVVYSGGGYVFGVGSTPFGFFTNAFGYPPGASVGGPTDLFMSDGSAKIGPNVSDVLFTTGTLFPSTITLPTNGKDFRASVSLGFEAPGTLVTTGEAIDVGGTVQGSIQFHFVDGLYYSDNFIQAPEPGTLGLLGIGLLGVAARARRLVVLRN